MTPTRSSAGSAPRTLRKPKAKLRAAVKSSPTGPREARREAVPLDGRAQRSYPNNHRPHSPKRWVDQILRFGARNAVADMRSNAFLPLTREPPIRPGKDLLFRAPAV
jgi:hypothetical protein